MTAAVKMFYQGGTAHLEEKLNAWLDETAGQVVIRALTIGGDMYGPCLTVIYEPGAGPVYRAIVRTEPLLDHLELHVNAALAAEGAGLPAFAAQSAEYGHCLCFINTVS